MQQLKTNKIKRNITILNVTEFRKLFEYCNCKSYNGFGPILISSKIVFTQNASKYCNRAHLPL